MFSFILSCQIFLSPLSILTFTENHSPSNCSISPPPKTLSSPSSLHPPSFPKIFSSFLFHVITFHDFFNPPFQFLNFRKFYPFSLIVVSSFTPHHTFLSFHLSQTFCPPSSLPKTILFLFNYSLIFQDFSSLISLFFFQKMFLSSLLHLQKDIYIFLNFPTPLLPCSHPSLSHFPIH